jgi:hypothetical protein
MSVPEAPLVRIGFALPDDSGEHHAVLTAVGGRVFCLSFDADLRQFPGASFRVDRVKHAWRSNF